MTQHRAYSVVNLKMGAATPDGKRTFTGIASTPSTDRMGDIVEPDGAQFKLPLPLLWQHDANDPIGWITAARVTGKGIEITGEVAAVSGDGTLKDRLERAWDYLKSGLVRGLSIGFNALESARIEGTYGLRFLKWEWLELSAVTIPANQDANITLIKSIDKEQRAALGPPGDRTRPGASGHSKQAASGRLFHSRSPKGTDMKTLTQLREERATKASRLTELSGLWTAENRSSTDEEGAEFDNLTDEVKSLDDEIRQARVHAMNSAAAKGVDGASSEGASRSRGGISFVKTTDPEDHFKGQSYVRGLIARAASFAMLKQGQFVAPDVIAQHRWGKSHPNLVRYIKAAVAGGGTGSGEWGAELAQSDSRYTGDFVEYLHAMTVYDRLPLREVPARVHIKGQDGIATGYWVGESKAIPVSKADFSDVELTPLKVGAIAVCSKELLADSSPSAERWIRDSIGHASGQRVDLTFLGEAAAVAGVSPAGILNGVAGSASSGDDAAALRADIFTLYQTFITARNASDLHLVMSPSLAKSISLLVNTLGQTEFPGLNAKGGMLLGDPVTTGDNVGGQSMILLKPSDIWKIGDSGLDVSMTDTATIEQNDAPAGAGDTPVAASATLMSLWQTEQVGFKVVRRINFQKRRSTAVAFMRNADYGSMTSS